MQTIAEDGFIFILNSNSLRFSARVSLLCVTKHSIEPPHFQLVLLVFKEFDPVLKINLWHSCWLLISESGFCP
jgi:hypothetical protein